ncbi:MAG: FtsX-like permease family protein [Dehalococcoidia bacterium]
MHTVTTILRMVIRHSLANRRLLATVIVGVVMSAALMSSVVLYSDSIRDLGLRYALRTANPLDRNVRINSSGRPGVADYAPRRAKVDELLRAHLGPALGEIVHYGRSATFYPAPPGEAFPQDENRPRAHFQFADRLDSEIRLVDGRKPNPPGNESPPQVEVMIGKASADKLGMKLGDSFDLHPFWRTDKAAVRVTIVGLIEPRDISDPYWFGKTDRFLSDTQNWQTYPFWVDEATVNGVLATYLPDMDSSVETYGLVNIGHINARNARSIEDGARSLDPAIREGVSGATAETKLADIVSSYRTKLFFTRLPLFALMLQVVGIALYYLVMVATMLIERQAGEIALLRSRGASSRQVVAIYAIEGFILCGAAALLGPYIARLGISVLGYTPPFENLSGNAALEVPMSRLAFAAAAGGAALAFAALLIPAWRAARQSTIDYKHSLARPQTQPIFLRYYMDLVLVGVGAFLFYQLREKGSLVTEKLFGDLSADPLLLASPTLFMLMVALVFLRVFPLALRFVAWATHRLESPTVALGLSRMTRAPMQYSRLILLLLLATAVGMFAAGYRATLERGYDDRAAFTAGAESRLENIRQPANVADSTMLDAVSRATDANDISLGSRGIGSYNISQYNSQPLTIDAVDTATFESVAFWREDFAGPSLSSLLDRLKIEKDESVTSRTIPAGARVLGLWAQFPYNPNVATIGIRTQDANGLYWDYTLVSSAPARAGEWRFFVADLTRPAQIRFNPQLSYSTLTDKRLDSVYVRIIGAPPQVPERVNVLIDELQTSAGGAVLPAGGFDDAQMIEEFDDMAPYVLITGASIGDPGAISVAQQQGRDGGNAARISFTRTRGLSPIVGLRGARTNLPLPVLAENEFTKVSGKHVGDEFTIFMNRQYVKVKLVGTFTYWPSYDPSHSEILLVSDLSAARELAATVPALADGVLANEAWMSPAIPGVMTREKLQARGMQADGLFDRRDVRAAQEADPLVAASWEGILFLSFAAVLLLTGLGFAVYATLAAQSRSLEFAILRTMGYTSRQVLSLVSFEQMFVIVAGVVVGTFLGFPLGRLMIGYLGVTESGTDPVPPLVSQVSWSAVLTVYGLLAVVFIGTIASLAAVYSRLAVHRALRIGEI